MYRFIRALLFLLPAEAAHALGMGALDLLSQLPGVCRILRQRALAKAPGLEVKIAGLTFAHPIALAAGLDKNADAVGGLFALGFSGVEVGTVTPVAQAGNPRPRLFRLSADSALINRMGFNNHGTSAMRDALRGDVFRPGPLGINIGKNKDTPLEHAEDDYVACVEGLAPLADYVVVNASSPNTPGLRALQEPAELTRLLTAVRARMDAVAPGKALFLKFAPDLSSAALDALVDVAVACRVDGLIATNTTLARPVTHALAAEAGGLSGKPLRELSTSAIRRAYRRAQGRLAIIGVGGVFNAEDAYEKIRAGASVIQVYSGFIYEGPPMIRRLLDGLVDLLHRDGFPDVASAVGTRASTGD